MPVSPKKNNSSMMSKTILLGLAGVLLLSSGAWVWQSFTTPLQRQETTTLVSYTGTGKYDYTVSVPPSYMYGPPYPTPQAKAESRALYFLHLVKFIYGEYNYVLTPSAPLREAASEVQIVGIVTGPSRWQKEFLLGSLTSSRESFSLSFPLELEKFDKEVSAVESELEIRPDYVTENTYDLLIEARVKVKVTTEAGQVIEDTFTQPISLNVGRGVLSWDTNLVQSEREFRDGVSYRQLGRFDYTITLNDSTLYPAGTKTIGPEPYQTSPLVARPAGEVYFMPLVEGMQTRFDWHFDCDKPVRNLTQDVEVTAVLESPKLWSKTYVIVPKTRKQGDFSLSFPVDIAYFNSLLSIIRDEIGQSALAHNLTIIAKVTVSGDTDFGPIRKTFTSTLEGRIGDNVLVFGKELVKSEPASIKQTDTVNNTQVRGQRIWSPVVLAVLFIGFGLAAVNAFRVKPVLDRAEGEAAKARRKYKRLIVDVREMPSVRLGETTITCGSVDEVVKVADALLKPVLHTVQGDRHVYSVIDGLTKYEYTSEP